MREQNEELEAHYKKMVAIVERERDMLTRRTKETSFWEKILG
jgi:ERCC4-type nuclease